MELKLGLYTWSPRGLLMCVLVLQAAIPTPSTSSKICMQIMKCMTKDYEMALMNHNVQRICELLPKVFECFQDAEEVCGDIGDQFNKQYKLLRTQYHKRCNVEPRVERVKKTGEGGVIQPSTATERPVSCSAEDLDMCISQSLLRAAQENNTEQLCDEGPEAIVCAERVVASCPKKDRLEKQQFVQNIKLMITEDSCKNSSPALHYSPGVLLLFVLTLHMLFSRCQ